MRRIAFMNQKGGVGKTTTVANLGAALAEMGRRVLVVDVDPQANLSAHLDFEQADGRPTIYEVLTGRARAEEAVFAPGPENLLMIPSSIDLSGAEIELVQQMGRETLLRNALEEMFAERDDLARDFLLLDCPPSLGLLSLNALTTATEVMIPIQTQYFALRGMSKLMEVIELVRRRLRPQLHVSMIIPSIADLRTNLTAEVMAEIQRFFGDRVARSLIRTNVRLAEAPSHGKSILDYDTSARGAEDYRRLAREVLGEVTEKDREFFLQMAAKLSREPVDFDELEPIPPPGEPEGEKGKDERDPP